MGRIRPVRDPGVVLLAPWPFSGALTLWPLGLLAGRPVAPVGQELVPFFAAQGTADHCAGLLFPAVRVHVPYEGDAAVVESDEVVAAGIEGRDVGSCSVLGSGQGPSELSQGGEVLDADLAVGGVRGQRPASRVERHRADKHGMRQPAHQPAAADTLAGQLTNRPRFAFGSTQQTTGPGAGPVRFRRRGGRCRAAAALGRPSAPRDRSR